MGVEDVTWPDGAVERYAKDAAGTWVSPSQGNDKLTSPTGGGWQLSDPSGDIYTFSAAGQLTSITDADGYITSLTYNSSAQLTSVTSYMTAGATSGTARTISLVWGACGSAQCITGATDSAGETVSYGYDSAGNLVSVVDVAGNGTGYVYNSSHQITGITDALSNTTDIGYDGSGRVDSVTDPLGNQTQWSGSLDSSGAGTITITDPLGHKTQDVFSTGEMTAQTVAAGTSAAATTTWTYDPTSDGVATTTTPADQNCPNGCQTTTAYTTAANGQGGAADDVATQTDPNGVQTTDTYGPDNQPVDVTTADGTDLAETTASTYNADGDLHQVQLPVVNSTVPATGSATVNGPIESAGEPTPTFTSTGEAFNTTSSTDSDIATETLTYEDQPGDPTEATVVDGTSNTSTSTTYTYDAYGNETTSTDQDGDKTTHGYNSLGQKTCEGTPAAAKTGNTCPAAGGAPVAGTTTYSYDSYANVVGTVDADGNTTTASYDPNGNELTSTDGNGRTTTNTYDADGNLIKTVGPDGATTTYTYDADGQKASETDPDGNTTTYTYDQRGNMVSEVDPGNQTTTWTYDLDNNKLTEVDPDKNTTTWTYDPDGRELTETQGYGTSDAQTVAWTYDANGNQASYIDAAGDATYYVYNGLNQLISQTVGDSTSPAVTSNPETTTWTYDANGDKATMVDPNGVQTTWSYDDADRLTGIGYSDTTAPVTYTNTPDGKVATMADGSGTTSYTYDADDQLTKYVNGAGQTVTYGYDPAGNVTQIGYPNGKTVTEAYNPAEQLKSVTDWNGNTTSFGYDHDGNQTSTAYPNGITDTRSYNSADQLTGITDTNSGGAKVLSFGYTVDPAWLITSETDTGTPGPSTTNYTYNALEQLTGAGSSSYTYDDANNLTTDPGGDSQAFNADGQLCWTASTATASTGCSSPPDGATNYAYDNDGNLTAVNPGTGSGTGYTWNAAAQLTAYEGTNQASYDYDANGLLQTETTPDGTTGFTWDTQASLPEIIADGTNYYIYGTGTGPVEQINQTTGAASYLLTDELGSTRAITGQNGNITGAISYDPWGNATGTTGVVNTPYEYAGAYLDQTSGLYYMRARWYSPATGQFLSLDPDVASTNAPYRYSDENPVAEIDPSGDASYYWIASRWYYEDYAGAESVAKEFGRISFGFKIGQTITEVIGPFSGPLATALEIAAMGEEALSEVFEAWDRGITKELNYFRRHGNKLRYRIIVGFGIKNHWDPGLWEQVGWRKSSRSKWHFS